MRIGNSRAPFLDYSKPGIFMITMNKNRGVPDFCRLNVSYPNFPEPTVRPDYYKVGYVIHNNLKNIKEISPFLRVIQYTIMPDHIHFIVEITHKNDKNLDEHMEALREKIHIDAFRKNLLPHYCSSIFEPGFNDQFLRHDRKLKVLINYIKKNPYNRWIRNDKPEYFEKINSMVINGTECQVYGNLSLLDNPFINAVVIHRRDTEAELERKKAEWRYAMANGGVLAGAFISKEEKNIFKGAAQWGGKIILISNKGLEEGEKPSGMLFKLCEQGRLLIIAPKMNIDYRDAHRFRKECLFMNAFAEGLSGNWPPIGRPITRPIARLGTSPKADEN